MVPAFVPGGLIRQQKDLFRALDGPQRFFRERLIGERIIVRLRKEVDFDIRSEDFKAIRTVGDLLDVLGRLAASKS